MNERYYPGRWFRLDDSWSIAYVPPGFRDAGTRIMREDFKHIIDIDEELNLLIDFLFKNGYIKPQLGENREEDTKIIHRLIDVIEKK